MMMPLMHVMFDEQNELGCKRRRRQNVETIKKTAEQNSLMAAVAWMLLLLLPTGPAMKCFASKLQLDVTFATPPAFYIHRLHTVRWMEQ